MRAFHRDSCENGRPRAAGKLPQFRDVHSLGVASNFARFAGRCGLATAASAVFYQAEVCRAIRDLEKYAVASPVRIGAL